MEAVAIEGVKFILEKLFAVAAEEINLVRGFKNELANLKKYLEKVNQVLEGAARREIIDGDVNSWLKDLKDAAYDADIVLDEIQYEELRRTRETEDEIKPKGCINILCCTNTTLTFQREMAHKIKDINANFKRINNEADSLGLNRDLKAYPLAKPRVEETTSFAVDPFVIGREVVESEILETITSSNNNALSVLPIVGMGGLGKTTLARKIYNHHRTETHFNKTIWVCVSENFDQMTVFERILELLLGEDFGGGSKEAVVQKIAEELKNKRYLLVLDDLWNEKTKDWDEFKKTLVGASSKKGNFIIVTTRKEKVVSIVNTCDHPCCLRSLTEVDCWSIIRKIAFQDKEVPEQFAITGQEIARKCGGLPLAANVIGRVLQGKEIEEWDSVLQSGLSILEEGEKGVLQVLKVSYNRLPSSSLKKCFAYCSMFIKDSVMDREDLIQLWMAKGFLLNNKKSEMETTGNTFFNILLQNFFFQEPEEDKYGNIISCKMHELLHDLACLISKSESFMNMEGRTADDILQDRHHAIESIGEDNKEAASYLGTLFLSSSYLDKIESIDEILPYFRHLHVLKLCDADIEELPTSIGNLKYLRYLDVSENEDLTTLPESICKLYNLQTLRILFGFQALRRLPRDLRFLIRLRHLCFDDVSSDFEMPPKIGSLSCLQTLPLFCVSDKEGCRIDELGKLKKLKGKLQIRNLELVSSKTEAELADMAGKPNIYKLYFHWRESTNSIESNVNDESVLEGLQPHATLKSLTIEGFRGKKFPFWTRNMGIKGIGSRLVTFDKLIKIKFNSCDKCEEIPMLGHLPHLKYLKLKNLGNLRSIRPSFYGEKRVSFRSLKRLTIQEMLNLKEWGEAQTSQMQVFPCLEYFKLSVCEKLTYVPHLRGSGASLKEMKISHCHGLRELPYDLGILQSLETLEIDSCRNLQSILYQNGQEGLRSLQSLEIHSCDELSNLPNEMLECCTTLQCLTVWDCPNLTSLPELSGMGSLQLLEVIRCHKLNSLPEMSGMESLQELTVIECKNLTSFPKLSGMGSLNSLRELCIGGFSNSMQFDSFQDSLDGMECNKSLENLYLHGQASWVSLPDQVKHLTFLKDLNINGFGMEALPDWFGNLSSLQFLGVECCLKLKHLPSKEAMQQLTKLAHLYIYSCPLMGERWRAESGPDSEWPKISNIPYVCIQD